MRQETLGSLDLVFDRLINGTEISIKTVLCSIMVIAGVYFVAKEPDAEDSSEESDVV